MTHFTPSISLLRILHGLTMTRLRTAVVAAQLLFVVALYKHALRSKPGLGAQYRMQHFPSALVHFTLPTMTRNGARGGGTSFLCYNQAFDPASSGNPDCGTPYHTLLVRCLLRVRQLYQHALNLWHNVFGACCRGRRLFNRTFCY